MLRHLMTSWNLNIKIMKCGFLESEKSFWCEIKKKNFQVSQVSFIRLEKQTSKNVADTTFKNLVVKKVQIKYLSIMIIIL